MSNQVNLDQPYMGKESLVISIDAGASASAVCIAHLQPGVTPRLKYVMEWPNSSKESKVPSCIYYDKTGMARACCAETRDEFIEVKAHDEGWVKVEEFKLLLNPPSMSASVIAGSASSSADADAVVGLPFGLTLTKVYADLFAYLVNNAQTWFQGVTLEGDDIWRRLYPTASIILAHPDGWTERQ